jgi:hypothetical protein
MVGWASCEEVVMRPHTLELSEAQRGALVRGRDRDPRPYYRERGAALLKVAGGQSPRQVALHGLGRRRKPETVRGWLAAYHSGGPAALVQRERGHRGFSPSAGGAAGRDGAPAA